MPPKRKTPPTLPHIANEDKYRQPSPPIIETEKQKLLRLDRKRKAVTKWYRANPNTTTSAIPLATILSPTPTTTFTSPLAASLDSVTVSGGSQSFISTTLAEAFAESTTFDLLPDLQRREANRIRQQQHRQYLKI
ncbi:3322_t:CDS:2 [Gigaspora rosea]|nr:3322_t:CDS:2 [Gigaspora rosea]